MKNYGKLFVIMVCICAATFFSSCDSSGSGGGAVTSGDLKGVWIADREDEGGPKTMLFDFGNSNFTCITYTFEGVEDGGMCQEEGERGTYTISDGKLKATITEEWQDDEEEENYMQWYELSSYSMESPISLEGNTLTIAMPLGEDGSLINVSFEKESFANPPELAGTWNGEGVGTIQLNADGTYENTSVDYYNSGRWYASSDMYRSITLNSSDEGDFYFENLYEYAIDGNTVTLFWEGVTIYTLTK